jgi:hypothetical protein
MNTSGYIVTHNSYSSAVTELIQATEKRGFTIDPDEIWNTISIGPAKPKEGQTNRFSLPILKDNQIQKKQLQVQICGLSNGRFELNMYIL